MKARSSGVFRVQATGCKGSFEPISSFRADAINISSFFFRRHSGSPLSRAYQLPKFEESFDFLGERVKASGEGRRGEEGKETKRRRTRKFISKLRTRSNT